MQKNKYRVKAATPEQKNAQEETVYFRLKKPIEQEEPQYQLIVNRNGRKIHHHNEEISVQSDRLKDQIKTNELTKMFGGMSLKKSAQYFLKRVDDIEIKYKNKGQQFLNNNLLPRSQKLAEQRHKQIRQNLFAKSRGIKIIDLNQPENFVEIGNNKIEVQNLGPMNQYYYILQKRKTIKQGPSISLPEQSIYLLESMQFEENGPDDDQISDGDEDSNRSSNPDYDYPEQEYHQGDSDDQGVIDRDYYTRNSDDEGYDSEPDQLDEEELYRRYLKRCKEDKDSSDGEYF